MDLLKLIVLCVFLTVFSLAVVGPFMIIILHA